MNVDELIKYIDEESLLIGLQLKCRAFLLVQTRYVDDLSTPCPTKILKLLLIERRMISLYRLDLKKKISWHYLFPTACKEGYLDFVKLIISKCNYDLFKGIRLAKKEGHDELVKWLIINQSISCSDGLIFACRIGHLESANLMISKGATNWNKGFSNACYGQHQELMNLMISKGATNLNLGLTISCRMKNTELVNWIISKGADKCNSDDCRKSIVEHLI